MNSIQNFCTFSCSSAKLDRLGSLCSIHCRPFWHFAILLNRHGLSDKVLDSLSIKRCVLTVPYLLRFKLSSCAVSVNFTFFGQQLGAIAFDFIQLK